MKKITSLSKFLACFLAGWLLAFSIHLAGAQEETRTVEDLYEEVESFELNGTSNFEPSNLAVEDDIVEEPAMQPEEAEGLIPPNLSGVEIGNGGGSVVITEEGQVFLEVAETAVNSIGLAAKNSDGVGVMIKGNGADDLGTVINTEGEVGLYTKGNKTGLKAGEGDNQIGIVAEGKEIGAAGRGEFAGLYAKSEDGIGIFSQSLQKTDVKAGTGIFGEGGQVGVLGVVLNSADELVWGALGILDSYASEGKSYGLFTPNNASFGELETTAFTVKGKLETFLATTGEILLGTSGDTGIIQADIITNTVLEGISIVGELAGSVQVKNNDLTVNRLSQATSAPAIFTFAQGIELKNTKIEVENSVGDAAVKFLDSVDVFGGDFIVAKDVTANAIGYFETQQFTSLEPTAHCNAAENWDWVLMGCSAKTTNAGVILEKVEPDFEDASCTALAEDNSEVTVYAYCFTPNKF